MKATKRPLRRRDFLRLMTYSCAAVPLVWITPNRAKAQGKAAKEAVNYQDSPKGDQKCDGCRFFTPPDSCQVVEGKISPNGWCSLFVAK